MLGKIEAGQVLEVAGPIQMLRMRVLVCDAHVTMVDAWTPKGWLIDVKSKRAVTYTYSTQPSTFLLQNADLVDQCPLTPLEERVHRPDLPLRALRQTGWNWSKEEFLTEDQFADAFQRAGATLRPQVHTAFPPTELYLYPRNKRIGFGRGRRFKPGLDSGFRAMELLWRAQQTQRTPFAPGESGFGIYRLGLRSGLPSYYVSSDIDVAGRLISSP